MAEYQASKLTADEIAEIQRLREGPRKKRRLDDPSSLDSLSLRFGVSKATICKAAKGRTKRVKECN